MTEISLINNTTAIEIALKPPGSSLLACEEDFTFHENSKTHAKLIGVGFHLRHRYLQYCPIPHPLNQYPPQPKPDARYRGGYG